MWAIAARSPKPWRSTSAVSVRRTLIEATPVLDRTIRGIKRVRGEGISRERKPITRDVLLKILGTFDVSTRQSATLNASFCLAFAAFLRIGECTWSSGDLEAV